MSKVIDRSNSAVFLIDVQERLFPKMFDRDNMLNAIETILKAAKILSVPIYSFEQYPKGLGVTVSEIQPYLDRAKHFEKTSFSGCGAKELDLAKMPYKQVVLVGIEAHVCVLQTAADLLDAGFAVFVPQEAVSSRKDTDCKIALKRMRQMGAQIVSLESTLFEWMQNACCPEFKTICQLIK